MTTTTRRPTTTFSAIFPWRSLKTRMTISTLAIFLIGIWSLAFYAGRILHADMERELGEQQFSTVSIIAADINDELKERLRSLEKTAARITPARMGNAASMQTFLENHPALESMFNAGIHVNRPDGILIADSQVSAGRIGVNYSDRTYMVEALKGKSNIGKPVMGRMLRAPVVPIAAPIRDTEGKVIGVLAGVINLGLPNFLDRITGSRYGKTGGYLLIAPQHNLFVTATDKSRIMQPLPPPGINPMHDRYMQGFEGFGIAVNSRGIEDLSAAKKIPVAGWFIVAALPTEEAFAPIRAMQRRMLLAAIFLTLLAGGLTWWMSTRQLAPIFTTIEALAALVDTDRPLQPLPITRQDEIGALIGGFNRLLETLGQREEALKQAEAEMALLADIGRLIGSTLEIDEVYEQVATEARKLLPFDSLMVNIKKQEENELLVSYVSGMDIPVRRKGARIPFTGSVAEAITCTKQGMLIQQESEEIVKRFPHYIPVIQAGLLSTISVPLISANKVIGVLVFRSKQPNAYTEQDLCLAERIGMHIAGAIANAQLYSERKQAEAKLKLQEMQLRTIVESTGDGILAADNAGKVIKANQKFTELWKIPPDLLEKGNSEALLTCLLGQLVDPDAFLNKVKQLYESTAIDFDTILFKDGKTMERYSSPLLSEGVVTGRVWSFRDITERKQAEEEKRRNQVITERLAREMSIIAEIGRLIGSTLDINEVYRRFDAEVSKLINYDRLMVNLIKPPDQFIVAYFSGIDNPARRLGNLYPLKGTNTGVVANKRSGIMIQPDTAEEIESLNPNNSEAFKEGFYSTMVIPLISMDEVIGSISFRSKILHAYTEKDLHLTERIGMQIAGAIVNAQIFSDLGKTEKSLRESEERLQRSEKMEALGQLAGGVAHDLNNVLGILTGYSELLLDEIPEGHRSRGHVEKILKSTEKGAAIIEDLLTMARRGVAATDVINLTTVVTGFLKTPVFEKIKDYHPRVIFRTECDENLLNIEGSPVHLEKTLMNLVSNAAEAISGKGEVVIRTQNRYLDAPIGGYDEVKQGDYVVLTVSDTGMGIPAGDREKVFEPFYTKKTMGRSGTGLGLAIVWGTVKDHNGYIDLQSEVGKGTTFTLYFPVTRDELIAPQQKVPIEQYMGKGESVLVVDDIAEQREIATKLLIRLGYKVQAVSGGEEAVEYCKGNKADILVLDMIMAPGIDGLETYQRILGISPKQKAILVSGFSETDRGRDAHKLGVGAYIKKPYIMEKIGVAIRAELDRR